MPPTMARIPGREVNIEANSLVDTRPVAKGTRTAMVRNNNPNSRPRLSTVGKYRSRWVNFRINRRLAAVEMMGDRPITPTMMRRMRNRSGFMSIPCPMDLLPLYVCRGQIISSSSIRPAGVADQTGRYPNEARGGGTPGTTRPRKGCSPG